MKYFDIGVLMLLGTGALVLLFPFPISYEPFSLNTKSCNKTDDPFMDLVQRSIQKNWRAEHSKKSYTIVTRFELDSRGNLQKREIVKSTGTPEAEKAALSALQSAAPFGDLPPRLCPRVIVDFTFAYNVAAGG